RRGWSVRPRPGPDSSWDPPSRVRLLFRVSWRVFWHVFWRFFWGVFRWCVFGCLRLDIGTFDQQVEGLGPDDIPGQRYDLTASLEILRDRFGFSAVRLGQDGDL